MKNPKVSIIIVNYNGKRTFKKSLDSIRRSDFPKDEVEIIVVDNNSTDGSLAILRKYPGVILIKNKDNRGFAEGNNIGIKKSKGEFIVLLNNDIIIKKDWIKRGIATMENNRFIGVLGGKIYYGGTKKIWFGGAKILPGLFVLHNYLNDKEGLSDYIAFSAVILRKSVLKRVGLFDEDFFLYVEDTDLCTRIKNGGYQIFYNPKMVSWHLISEKRASAHEEYFEQRNRSYHFIKHFKYPKLGGIILDFFLFFPLFWLNRIIRNPKKLKFLRETVKARKDSLKMIFQNVYKIKIKDS